MSMHQRNDRSVHTDAKTIRRNLQRHAQLMAIYQKRGIPAEYSARLASEDMGVRRVRSAPA